MKTIREKIEEVLNLMLYDGLTDKKAVVWESKFIECVDQIEKLIEEERKIATEAAFELGYFHGKNEGKPIK